MYALQSEKFLANPYVYALPGITPETIATCSRLLEDNHQRFHIFFNEQAFHNHTTHHLLAALGFGASSETLEQIYERQKKIQKPALRIHKEQEFDPEKCIGDDHFYPDYVEFFKRELEEKYHGKIEDIIEDYVFNKNYLSLIFGGAFHSFIHLGYALEFQSKVMAIEGLAMAAIDRVSVETVLANVKYDSDGDKSGLDVIKLALEDKRFNEIIAFHDEGFRPDKFLTNGGGSLITEYAQMWKCDVNDLRRIGVLANAAVIRPNKAPRLNFFLMHATTSCLFLEIFIHALKNKENQIKLLRAKFAVDLLYYAAYGRPKLNLDYLINGYQPSKEHSYADSQNPWLPLIDKCLTHPDEHVPKTIRALAYAERFDPAEGNDKLPYLKIAQLVMDCLFPAGEKDWEFESIGWNEYWQTVEDQ